MLGTVFGKALYDMRRAVAGFGIGIVATVALMAAMWPSIRGIEGIEAFLDSYPDAMRELFSIDTITTGAGFMNAELFSILLPVLFIVLAVSRGARLVAGDEQAGTLEPLLLTPPSRARVTVERAGALLAVLVTLGIVLAVTLVISSPLVDLGLGVADVAAAALSMVLLGAVHGAVAVAVGAATGRRVLAIGIASVVAAAGYVLYIAATFIESLGAWGALSPFTIVLEDGPLGRGMHPGYGWLLLVAVVVVAASLPVFERRDLVLP